MKSNGLGRSEGRGLEIYIWDNCNCHWGGVPHRAPSEIHLIGGWLYPFPQHLGL